MDLTTFATTMTVKNASVCYSMVVPVFLAPPMRLCSGRSGTTVGTMA